MRPMGKTMKKKRRFKWKQFAGDVRKMRDNMQMGLREAARCLGIHHATWCRAEQGKAIEVEDFVFICDWMAKEPTEYLTKRAGCTIGSEVVR